MILLKIYVYVHIYTYSMPIWLKFSPEVSSDLHEHLLQTSVLYLEDVTFRGSLMETWKHGFSYTNFHGKVHCSPWVMLFTHTLDRITEKLTVSRSPLIVSVLWVFWLWLSTCCLTLNVPKGQCYTFLIIPCLPLIPCTNTHWVWVIIYWGWIFFCLNSPKEFLLHEQWLKCFSV